jgi:chromosome segregation ATPase
MTSDLCQTCARSVSPLWNGICGRCIDDLAAAAKMATGALADAADLQRRLTAAEAERDELRQKLHDAEVTVKALDRHHAREAEGRDRATDRLRQLAEVAEGYKVRLSAEALREVLDERDRLREENERLELDAAKWKAAYRKACGDADQRATESGRLMARLYKRLEVAERALNGIRIAKCGADCVCCRSDAEEAESALRTIRGEPDSVTDPATKRRRFLTTAEQAGDPGTTVLAVPVLPGDEEADRIVERLKRKREADRG